MSAPRRSTRSLNMFSAHWATVTQAAPFRIQPDGSTRDAPATAFGYTPTAGDRVVYLYVAGNQLVVIGGGTSTSVVSGGLPVAVLKLSPTDAEFNDDAIDAAIASFGWNMGTIYAPAGQQLTDSGSGSDFQVWPFAREHDFRNCDLIGAGNYVYEGGGIDEGPPGTTFLCVEHTAKFIFSGQGNVTGGFKLNANQVSTQPFSRDLDPGGGDLGRIFQNISVHESAPHPDANLNTCIITQWQSFATLTVQITNDAGTEITSALTASTLDAATLQAALEALSNVGVGGAIVAPQSGDPTQAGVGGPWFIDVRNASGASGGSGDSRVATAEGWSIVSQPSESGSGAGRARDACAIYVRSYLDTFINMAIVRASEHGMYLDGSFNCTFIDCDTNGMGLGYGYLFDRCEHISFKGGDLEVVGLSMFFDVSNSSCIYINGMSFFQNINSACPIFDLVNAGNGWVISNVQFNSDSSSIANIVIGGNAVALNGYIDWEPNITFAIFQSSGQLDNKALWINNNLPTFEFFGGTRVEQASAIFGSGITGWINTTPFNARDMGLVAATFDPMQAAPVGSQLTTDNMGLVRIKVPADIPNYAVVYVTDAGIGLTAAWLAVYSLDATLQGAFDVTADWGSTGVKVVDISSAVGSLYGGTSDQQYYIGLFAAGAVLPKLAYNGGLPLSDFGGQPAQDYVAGVLAMIPGSSTVPAGFSPSTLVPGVRYLVGLKM